MLRMRAMHRRRRNRRRIPPWVYFKTPNDKGERKIELEDIQLWKTMDLNKDGKLTVAEYERFAKSADAQKFVRGMKERKAVEQWAAMIGIDVNKARAAMKLGAHHQRRRSYLHRQRHARAMAHRRRQAIAQKPNDGNETPSTTNQLHGQARTTILCSHETLSSCTTSWRRIVDDASRST